MFPVLLHTLDFFSLGSGFIDAATPSYEKFWNQPTLLWFAGDFGFTTEAGMDLLCLVGTFLSLMAMVTRSWRDFSTFFSLWFLYFSVYQVLSMICGFLSGIPRVLGTRPD